VKKEIEENQENDLLDAMVGTGVSTAILMGIFVLVTVLSFFV
jgi:hypothetical protein